MKHLANSTVGFLSRLIRSLAPARLDQYLYELNLKQPVVRSLLDADERVRRYSIDDPSGIPAIDQHLSRKRTCFCLHVGDSLVHESWLFRDVWLPRRYGFPKDVPVIGASKTPESFRGRGNYPKTLTWIAKHCRDVGDGHVFILVACDNAASIRGIEKAGFSRRARLQATRVLGLLFGKNRSSD